VASNADLEAANADLEARTAQLVASNAELEARTAQLEARTAQLEAANADLEARTAQLVTANAELEARTAQLVASNAELEARTAQLVASNAELEARTAQLEASNAELDAFSYSISHDLRAPLRAIDGFARIVGEQHGDEVPERIRRYLDLIRKGAQDMGALIDGLLSFSRLGQQGLVLRQLAPEPLVREVVAELRAQQNGGSAGVVIGELPSVNADAVLLRQVFVNLVANAFKFTRGRDEARIDIGCREQGGERVFFVADNGIGFDMLYVDQLFKVFQRLHRAEDYEGSGLGLALADRIVRRHGGRMWAEGEEGVGATFYFTLEGGPR
jgi:light-regulated signal transduction histidine kinase (bacteriophytochrome)